MLKQEKSNTQQDSKKALLLTGHYHIVYGMHYHAASSALAVGGKEGIVSVFACGDASSSSAAAAAAVPDLTLQPLVVAKAHKRWVCDVSVCA